MKKKYWYVIVSFLIIASISFYFIRKSSSAQTQEYPTAVVTRGDISMKVSGTGNLSSDIKTITLKGNGTVKKVYFKVGDTVKKGDLLYVIQDDNLNQQLEQAQLSLDLAKQQLNVDTQNYNSNISNLNITSPSDGVIDSVLVKEGQNVNPGTPVATIVDYSHVTVKVPFNGVQINNIKVGQKADIFLYDSFTSVSGTVEYVSHQGIPNDTAEYYYVTVGLDNPGALSDGMRVQVSIHTDNGIERAIQDGNLSVKNTYNVTAQTSGTVDKINVQEGENVKAGALIVRLSSNISNAQVQNDNLKLVQAQNSYNQILEQVNNLKVFSPIDGKIISQNINEGDQLSSGTANANSNQGSQVNIAQISDISQISNYESQAETAVIASNKSYAVVVPIDEADINKVKIGQKAEITTDDIPAKLFSGIVSGISSIPAIQNNVSSYNVTVKMDYDKDLMLGMSMNVSILVNESKNTLILPIQAIGTNGSRKYVILYNNNLKTQDNAKNKSNFRNNIKYVETGLFDDNYIEILSGLSEGDKVLIPNITASNSANSRIPGTFGQTGRIFPNGGFGVNKIGKVPAKAK